MKFIVVKFLIVIFISDSISQNAEKVRYAKGALGATWQTRRDNLFSPLSYSGIGAELHMGSEKLSDKWHKSFDIWGGFNYVKTRVDNGYNSISYAYRYGLNYMLLKRIKPSETRFKWYLGGQFYHIGNGMYYASNVNNLLSFDLPVGFAASTIIFKDISFWRRTWHLSSSLTIPIAAVNARPNYLGFIGNDFTDTQIGFSSLHNLLFIDWRWMIDFPISNGNRFRFTYRWDYWSDKLKGKLQQGTQTLLFETLLNLPYRQKNKHIQKS
jgi:hypothetical protein